MASSHNHQKPSFAPLSSIGIRRATRITPRIPAVFAWAARAVQATKTPAANTRNYLSWIAKAFVYPYVLYDARDAAARVYSAVVDALPGGGL